MLILMAVNMYALNRNFIKEEFSERNTDVRDRYEIIYIILEDTSKQHHT